MISYRRSTSYVKSEDATGIEIPSPRATARVPALDGPREGKMRRVGCQARRRAGGGATRWRLGRGRARRLPMFGLDSTEFRAGIPARSAGE